MTILSSTARMQYTGAGSAGPFSYTFKIFDADELEVTKRSAAGAETALAYPADFSVTGVRNKNGGTITLTTALASGEMLAIRRVLPITQPTDLRNLGAFLPEVHEDQLDRLVMIDLQQQDKIDRTLTLDETLDPADYDLTLPVPETGKVMTGTGTGFTMSALDSSAVSLPGESRVVPTLSAYLLNNRVYNANDYYTAGVTASRNAAFNAAIVAANAVGGGAVRVPAGSYTMASSQVVLLSNVRLVGDGKEVTTLTWNYAGGIGISATSKTNIAVQGLTITGLLAFGIVFDHCTGFDIRHNAISGCTSDTHVTGYAGGIHAWVPSDGTIEYNELSGNGNTTPGHLSADIQLNGNGANTGSPRMRVNHNRCLSTATQTCIAAYDVYRSEFNFNELTGAKTGAGNNNGYGLLLYRSVNNTGLHEQNVIIGGHIHDCDSSGVYLQSSHRTRVEGLVIDRCGTVMDDTTLPVGAIATNGCDEITITNCGGVDNGKASIVIAGTTAEGYAVSNCEFTTTVAGVRHLLFRAPAKRGEFSNLSFKGGAAGIATLSTVDTFLVNLQFCNVGIEDVTGGRGVDLYGIKHSTFTAVRVKGSGGNGFSIAGSVTNPTATSDNTIIACHAWDGGTIGDNVYDGFNISRAPRTKMIGCTAGNTGGTGFRYGIVLDATNTGSSVSGCSAVGGRTGPYLVDSTLGFWGNYDPASAFPNVFQARQMAVISGSAASITQLLLGDSSVYGAIGTRWSAGDGCWSANASHTLGSDLWHQSSAGSPSRLIRLTISGDIEHFAAAAGTADGTFAAFWGTPIASFTTAGRLKLSGTQVLQNRITGYTAMTGTPDKATAYATGTVTLAQLAGRVAQLQADLTTHGVIGA